MVHARHATVRLALEGPVQVVHSMRVGRLKPDDAEHEDFGLVERIEDLVFRDRDRRCPFHTALDLDEPQLARAGHAAFDVVAVLLELAVGRIKAEAAFDIDDNGVCPCGTDLGVGGGGR